MRLARFFGLGLITGLVAVLGPASVATATQFHVEKAPAVISGTQVGVQEFTTESGTVSCNTAAFSGAMSSTTAESLTLSFAYSECENPLLGEVTIDANGCDTVATTGGNLELICPVGKTITMTAPVCTVHWENQGVSFVTYDNAGSFFNRDIKLTTKITGIKYIQTGSFCPGNGFASSKTFTNGTFTASHTIHADKEGSQVGLWVE